MAVLAGFFLLGSCSYDDTLVREEIGKVEAELSGYEQKMAKLESQMSSLTALINSSFISYLGTDEEGNYVVSYMNEGKEVSTVVVAVDSDVVTDPLIGAAEFEGTLYWTKTSDNGKTWDWILDAQGNKMPVGGVEPEVKIDAEGFWAVNGERVIGADGNPVLANDVSNTLFKGIRYNEETGYVEFTLVDGSVFSVRLYEALNIEFDAPAMIAVPDPSAAIRRRCLLHHSCPVQRACAPLPCARCQSRRRSLRRPPAAAPQAPAQRGRFPAAAPRARPTHFRLRAAYAADPWFPSADSTPARSRPLPPAAPCAYRQAGQTPAHPPSVPSRR